jgi:GNAT superfamily N-acetyltransferase
MMTGRAALSALPSVVFLGASGQWRRQGNPTIPAAWRLRPASTPMGSIDHMEIHPLTPDRWQDLEQLFGRRGAYGGCWCMWNRLTNREFEASSGDEKREMLRDIVDDRVAGLLAYEDGTPVGWVSLGPREEFGRIQRSRVTRAVDEVPVWSIVCFVIERNHRGRGVGSALLQAAVEYARDNGAVAIEGYPVEPRRDRMPDIYAWMGLASMFESGGFTEIARRSDTRPLFRKVLR